MASMATEQQMKFKCKDRVTWTSSSNGSTKAKTGVIVDVIPPRGRLSAAHRDFGLGNYGTTRDHESYIVHVAGKTAKAKGKRYWPRVNKLQLIGEKV